MRRQSTGDVWQHFHSVVRTVRIYMLFPMLAVGYGVSGSVENARWLVENQVYHLVLNPETIQEMTDYPFEIYFDGGEQRLVISDRRDGLWRVNDDLVFFQSTRSDEPLADLPGDQHTLSFDKAQNILIERLDIYAHDVEEALKFSACANVVVRDSRLISSRASEDAADIVRGQNYIFDRVWFIGLGDRGMTVKGSARYVDIIESNFGLESPEDFLEVFGREEVLIGDQTFRTGDKLLPRKIIPHWINVCLFGSSDRSLGVELGGWSDYDIGFINEDGEWEARPPTLDVRIDAWFADGMTWECHRSKGLVPVLQWHTAERVTATGWIFRPAETPVFGDLVEDLYYEISEPSPEREAELREQLGSELDYWNVELPRYAIEPQTFGNNRFFGALYNHDNQIIYSPILGWLYVVRSGDLGHDLMQPGTWLFHFSTASWIVFLEGEILPVARWWNASEGAYYHGALVPE